MSTILTLLGAAGTAVVTAVATTWVTGTTITPRLDARKARVVAAHNDRDRFSDSILTILASCSRLEAFQIPPEVSEPLRTALFRERSRWFEQIDEATCWLVDNTQRWAGTYLGVGGLRDLAIRYATDARGVFISERSEADKIKILREITEPIQEIFFARGQWRHPTRLPNHQQRLADALDQLERDPDESATAQVKQAAHRSDRNQYKSDSGAAVQVQDGGSPGHQLGEPPAAGH